MLNPSNESYNKALSLLKTCSSKGQDLSRSALQLSDDENLTNYSQSSISDSDLEQFIITYSSGGRMTPRLNADIRTCIYSFLPA